MFMPSSSFFLLLLFEAQIMCFLYLINEKLCDIDAHHGFYSCCNRSFSIFNAVLSLSLSLVFAWSFIRFRGTPIPFAAWRRSSCSRWGTRRWFWRRPTSRSSTYRPTSPPSTPRWSVIAKSSRISSEGQRNSLENRLNPRMFSNRMWFYWLNKSSKRWPYARTLDAQVVSCFWCLCWRNSGI